MPADTAAAMRDILFLPSTNLLFKTFHTTPYDVITCVKLEKGLFSSAISFVAPALGSDTGTYCTVMRQGENVVTYGEGQGVVTTKDGKGMAT